MNARKVAIGAVALGFMAIVAWQAGSGLAAYEPLAGSLEPDSAAVAEADQRTFEIALYERRLKEEPESALDLAQLAGLYLQRGRETAQYEDILRAEQAARQSLALRTNRNGKTYLTLASSLLAQHRFSEALEVSRAVVAYDPDIPAYRAMLGEVQLELGDYDEARSTFRSLSGDRTVPSVAARLARWAEIEGRTEDARAILNVTLQDMLRRSDLPSEQVAWFYLRRGDIELKEGRLAEAKNAYRAGLDQWPNDYRLLGAMARLELARNRPRRAIAYGERSMAITLDPAILGVIGEAYAARKDSVKAEEYYRTMQIAVVRQPGAFHRAWSLFLLDHDRATDEVLAKAREEIASRKDIYGYDLLAWALYKRGEYAEARHQMRYALRLATRDAMLYYHAGMIERAMGDPEAARKHLTRALEINKYFSRSSVRTARAVLDSIKDRSTLLAGRSPGAPAFFFSASGG
ncbi:MAG: tetratricopeptide repeat protein [Gemmatimonadaceae bacterium]